MVSHQQKCIFVHIPKTAGTSIEMFFKKELGLPPGTKAPLALSRNKVEEIGPPHLTHLKAHEFYENQYVTKNQFNEYFKFSFVRNPWDRVVSFYKYSNLDLLISFESFIKKELPRLMNQISYFYSPQYDFIYHEEKKLVDFVGRFENLHQDFDKVCDTLEISDSTLPHTRKTKVITFRKWWNEIQKNLKRSPRLLLKYSPDKIDSTDYKDYYTKAGTLKDEVYRLYKKDIEAFSYSF